MIKVFIADDHTLIREGIKNLIENEPDLKFVGETSNPFEIIDKCRNTNADLVILDLSMPGKSGLDVLKDIKAVTPNIKVLIMTMMPEDQFAKRTLKAGASGYITKDSPPNDIIDAIRRVAAGRKYVSISLAEKLAESLDTNADKLPSDLLSDREFQIFKMIASGRKQTEIADDLSLSISTVNTYRKRIFDKFKFKSNAELIHFAINNKLLD